MKVLSKTDFIHYLRCPDSLWLEKNKPDKYKRGLLSVFLSNSYIPYNKRFYYDY